MKFLSPLPLTEAREGEREETREAGGRKVREAGVREGDNEKREGGSRYIRCD